MKARCNNNISSITYKSLLNQTSSTYKSAAKAQGNVKNIKKPIQPIYVAGHEYYEKCAKRVWEISEIRVILQKNYEKYLFRKMFLIVYYINYQRFNLKSWEYEKWKWKIRSSGTPESKLKNGSCFRDMSRFYVVIKIIVSLFLLSKVW